MQKPFLITILLITCTALAASASIYALEPEQDSFLDENDPFRNWGHNPELWNQQYDNDDSRSVLQFDLSGISADATLIRAGLMIYVTWPDESGLPVTVHRITDAWTESGVNWDNTADDHDPDTVYGSFTPTAIGQYAIDVTTLVQEWIDGDHPNNGLMLLSTSTGYTSLFASKESHVMGQVPSLIIQTEDQSTGKGLRVATGTYEGDDSGGRQITGVGFRPDFVIVKGNLGKFGVGKSATMSAGLSKEMDGELPAQTDMIVSLDDDGFTIGSCDAVNHANDDYYWIALKGDEGVMRTGYYIGDETDDRSILGLGFMPDQVFVMSEAEVDAVQRSSVMPDGWSFPLGNDFEATNLIQRMLPGGFQIGSSPIVNGDGDRIHYVAWLATEEAVSVGSYWGEEGQDDRFIPVGFEPDYVFVKGTNEWSSAHKPRSLVGDWTLSFRDIVNFSDAIQTFVPDGFEVGTHGRVNAPDEHYYWLAFRDSPAVSDLEISKLVDDPTPNEGEAVVYTVSVVNGGPGYASGIVVADMLPPGVTYDSHKESQGAYDHDLGAWAVGGLADHGVAELQITANVNAGTSGSVITNTATVESLDQDDPDGSNNSAAAGILVHDGSFRMATGVYVGNSSGGQSITNVGFHPDVVIVRSKDAGPSILRTSTMEGDQSKPLGPNSALLSDLITSLDRDGFTVGSDPAVNSNGIDHFWVAFHTDPEHLAVGSYIGNMQDNRSVSGVGFEPEYVIIASEDSEEAMQRFVAENADKSLPFMASNEEGDRIQDFEPDGFEIGKHNTVNKSDVLHHFVAWNEMGGSVRSSMYEGDNSDDRPIGGVGFEPDYVILSHKEDDAPSVHRPASLGGDNTLPVDDSGVVFEDGIQEFQPDGFEIGSDVSVNHDNKAFFYTAFRHNPPAEADLELSKIVDNPTPNEEETVNFTITVINNGPGTATGVVVADLLPDGLTFDSSTPSQGSYNLETGIWSLGGLPSPGGATLVLTATVNSGTGGSTITNTATIAHSDQVDPDGSNGTDAASIVVQSADLEIGKVVDDPTPNEGDAIIYTITLTNNGPTDATGIEVVDQLPTGVTFDSDAPSMGTYDSETGVWSIDDLANGADAILILMATVDEGTGGSVITNTAAITASDQVDPHGGNNSADADISIASADLSIGKLVSNPRPNENEEVDYTITLKNEGPDAATGIEVTDQLPNGVTYDSDETSHGSYNSETGVWAVGELADAATAVLTLTAIVDAGTGGQTIVNAAGVSRVDQFDPDGDDNLSQVGLTVQSADLAVQKIVNDPNPNEGDEIVYTITLSNEGPDEATGIEVLDALPGGLTFDSADPSQGSYNAETGIWVAGEVASGGDAVLTLTAVADAGSAGETIVNTARVVESDQADPTEANNADSASLTVQSADLAVEKIVDDASPNEGDTITYTVTLTNEGPSTATSVEITDRLPAGLSLESVVAEPGSFDTETGVWSLNELAASGNAVLTLTCTVETGTGGLTLVNMARVTSADQADPDPGNNEYSVDVTVQSADLGIEKIVDDPNPNDGDTITYTVTLSNAGPNIATGVEVTDQLPDGIIHVSSEPSQGEYDPATGLWVVGTVGTSTPLTLEITGTVDLSLSDLALITNTAAVTAADQSDPDTENNSASVAINVLQVDLSVAKTVDRPNPGEGETVTYTVRLKNDGPDDGTGIELTDQLPDGVTYESDDPSQGGYNPDTGLWTVGEIAEGGEAVLSLTAIVDSGTGGSTITNVAAISAADQADPNLLNNSSSAAIGAQSADLEVAKSVDDGQPNESDTIEYTISLTNHGPNDATGIEIVDQLPDGVSFVSADPSRGAYYSDTGLWNVGNLNNGSIATLSLIATVDAGTGGMGITNTATLIGADQPDPNGANNVESAGISVQVRLSISANAQTAHSLQPGADPVEMFRVKLQNPAAVAETLLAVTVTNATSGPGTEAQRDAEWSDLSLFTERDGVLNPSSIATATFSGGEATFSGFSEVIAAADEVDLLVLSGASLVARDSDHLDLEIVESGDLAFTRAVAVEGSWPVDPHGSYPVDGMVREQITLTPVSGGEVMVGSANILALDFTVPSNGYSEDTVHQIRLQNLGTAENGTEVSAVDLWSDGGNGTFDTGGGDDTHLGTAAWDGSFWTLPTVSVQVPVDGLRLFASVDLDPMATTGRTIHLSIPASPDNGLEMTSDNDGPLDLPATNPAAQTIVDDPSAVLQITAIGFDETVINPGGPVREVFRLSIDNQSGLSETITSVTLENASTGPGSQAELDASWRDLTLSVIEGNKKEANAETPTMAGSVAYFSNGVATFTGLSIPLPAHDSVVLSVVSGASLSSRDGDVLDIRMSSAERLSFSIPITIDADWPLEPAGFFTIDGMSAAQIVVEPVADAAVFAGEVRRLAFDFTVPANGYETDTIEQIQLLNLGDATEASDIETVEIWRDHGNGLFDAGDNDDQLLGSAVWSDGFWLLGVLSIPVPLEGVRIFVSVDVKTEATEDRTIRFALPAAPDEGVRMASGNDGPVDQILSNPGALTIMRAAEAVITVSADRQSSRALLPGGAPEEVFTLRFVNFTAETETLTGITYHNSSTGLGTSSDLDDDWSSFSLMVEGGGGDSEDGVVATGSITDGRLELSDLSIVLPIRETVTVALLAGASINARDGDLLDLSVLSAGDIQFSRAVDLSAVWPLDPIGELAVDGMAADQISLHPVDSQVFPAGSTRNLALDVTIPANGYEVDELNRFDVLNVGTAVSEIDLVGLELWLDTGDGRFTPAEDRLLGPMTYTGDRWEITALSEPVPLNGIRVFVTVEIGELATGGRTVQLLLPTLPDVALGMGTGNDGPRDRTLENPFTQVISRVDRVTFSGAPISSGLVRPGDRDVPLLHLIAVNTYDTPRVVTSLAFGNATSGTGSTVELDRECEVLVLHDDLDGDGIFESSGSDPVIGTASFSDGKAIFRGLHWELEPGVSRHLFLTADVSLRDATDGDILAAEIVHPLDIDFEEPTALVADWPVESGARWIVDGMVAEQITNFGGEVATLGPGQGPALALDVQVPANGYTVDVIERFRVTNLGTATTSEIADLHLWRDGGDGAFSHSGGDDLDLGSLYWSGEDWVSATLSETIPLAGSRFFVSLNVSGNLADSASVRLAIPVDGIEVSSENDGPIDVAIESPEALLLSAASLLTTIRSEPWVSTIGQNVTVRMIVANRSNETIEGVAPSPLGQEGSATLTLVSGPVPSGVTLAPAEADTFVWQFVGESAGETILKGHAEGIGASSGVITHSLISRSNIQKVFVEARKLDVYSIGSQPYSVTLGESGVIPLSLTFRNPGGEDGSNVNLTGLRIRLEEEDGTGIVPADLFDRVEVNEGSRVYLSKSGANLETVGAEVDLTLASPVLITTFEPVTVNLKFDISPDAILPTFRVVIPDSTWFNSADATNSAPVMVALPQEEFPIRSGLARLVREATGVDVSAAEATPYRVGPGQAEIELLKIGLENIGIEGISSDARLGSFAVQLVDEAGTPLQDAGGYLSGIRVQTAYQTLAEYTIEETDAAEIGLPFFNALTLPVNTPTEVKILGDTALDATVGSFRLRLASESSFEIRDATTQVDVPATFLIAPIEGGLVSVESPAQSIQAIGIPEFPSLLTVGDRDVVAMTGWFHHPGSEGTARIRLDSLSVSCWDEDRNLLAPGANLDRIRLLWNDSEVATLADLSTLEQPTTMRLPGQMLEPGDSAAVAFIIDIEASAPSSSLLLTAEAPAIWACDANGGQRVTVEVGAGSTIPFHSGTARLGMPPRELLVDAVSMVPAALAADGQDYAVALLSLTNPAAEGSGPIRIDHLVTRAADSNEAPLAVGAVTADIAAYKEEILWAESAPLAKDATTAIVEFPEVILVEPGETVDLEIRVNFREDRTGSNVRFGWDSEDIGIVQPGGALLLIETRHVEGRSFPLWTEVGNFSTTTFDESFANFPNPFAAGREETSFIYYLPTDGQVTLRLWTSRAEKVVTLLDAKDQMAGLHQHVRWDGKNGNGSTVINGVYVAELNVRFADGSTKRLLHKVAVVR